MTEFLYLAKDKDGKQLGLFKSHEQSFVNPKTHIAEMWELNEKTGQYHPTNASVGRLEILPKK